MVKNLSQRWLMALICIGTMLLALRPALFSHLICFGGFLLCFIWRDEKGEFAAPNKITACLFAILFAYFTLALQWSPIPARGFYDLIIMGLLMLLGLQINAGMKDVSFADTQSLLRIFAGLFFASLLIFAVDLNCNLLFQRASHFMPWDNDPSFAMVSRSAYCLVLLLWPLLAYAWRQGWRVAAIFTWFILGVLLLFSDSAAGRMAFVISTFAFAFASYWPRTLRIIMAVILITGMAVAVPVGQALEPGFGDSTKKISGSFAHRMEIWRFAAARIIEKPWLGWGFDSARAIPNLGETSKYQEDAAGKHIIPMHTHNWFLQILLELGAVGGVLMTLAWLWLLRQTTELHRTVQPVALACFSVAMVIGAFSIGIWQQWWWGAIIFAAIIVQLCNRQTYETDRTGQ